MFNYITYGDLLLAFFGSQKVNFILRIENGFKPLISFYTMKSRKRFEEYIKSDKTGALVNR